jgi:hypothetical protein
MNTRGNPKRLVAAQPGNLNAVKQRVHSPRLIQARAAEIASELTRSFELACRAARRARGCSLQRTALGQDATATAGDRLAALKELLELGPTGTSSYLERPAQPELTEREHAIREAIQRQSLAQREREHGIG